MSRIEETIQRHWKQDMPNIIPPVGDYTVFLWSKHDINDVLFAIQSAGKKMAKNIRENVPMEEDSAQKYVSSIIGSRSAWRKQREAEKNKGGQS